MPEINKIPQVLHQPMDPYHWAYDNLPLKNIHTKLELINAAVDINSDILRGSVGSQGTLAARLAESLEANGTLRPAAVDTAQHNIGAHADGIYAVSSDEITDYDNLGYTITSPASFVRMLDAERNKLALVSNEATALRLKVVTEDGDFSFDDEEVILSDSESLKWAVQGSNELIATSVSIADKHQYGIEPGTTDRTTFKSSPTGAAVPFVERSLRVYVNGMRLNPAYTTKTTMVPPANPNSGDLWMATEYTENHTAGTFTLNRTLTTSDVILIDYDVSFA